MFVFPLREHNIFEGHELKMIERNIIIVNLNKLISFNYNSKNEGRM